MYVITADQVDSRGTGDIASAAVERFNARDRLELALPVDRTAGDEIQLVLERATDVLDTVLELTRDGRWSVGLGVGEVALASTARESTGAAFVAARRAVDRAKRRPTRFALESEPPSDTAGDAEALLDLLLTIRKRRSDEGWELAELLADGRTQADAAATLGISAQAASKRARAAELKIEAAARDPLVRLIQALDSPTPPEA